MTSPTTAVVPTGPDPEQRGAERGDGPPSKRGLGPVRRTVREIGLALITAGVIILLFVAYELLGTGIAEAHSQSSLKKQFNATVSQHTTAGRDTPTVTIPAGKGSSAPPVPTGGTVPTGGAIDHLVIPRIGVDKFVVQGVSEEDLRRGPGHYPDTVMLGQTGNAAIAGHRTTYGAPFFDLNKLTVGDPIDITDLSGHTFVYKVSQAPLVVSPDDVSVLDQTPFAQLTLTTCTPRFSASSRMVIFARLSGPALPAPHLATGPSSTPAAQAHAQALATALATENLGQGNSHAWGPALLWGALVLGLWVLVRFWIHYTRRWARAAAYLVGIAACLIPLWFSFENVVLLLPQNI